MEFFFVVTNRLKTKKRYKNFSITIALSMLGDRRKLKIYLDISKIGLGHPEREKIINLSMLNTQTLVPCSILLTLVFVTWFLKTIIKM